jgi:NADH dehydrogenase (ubiquinone) Fe-S protein 6
MLTRRLVPRLGHRLKSFSRAASSSAPPTSSSPPVPTSTSTPAPQSPNQATTWSTNQRPRALAYQNARFEQTAMELQPNPLSAMDLISKEPVRVVHGRKAVCDGGQSCYPTMVLIEPYSMLIFARRRTPRPPEDIYQLGIHYQFCNSLAHV